MKRTFAQIVLFTLQLQRHVGFWLVALVLGIAAGSAAVLFRMGIVALQTWAYGTDDVHLLHSHAERLEWYWILLIPTLGGIVVGLIFQFMTPDSRVRSVADVIEGAALHDGRVERRIGIASAIASLITLSTGGSTGREGPVVHIAGMLSSTVSDWLKVDGITGRDLLGCAVAAAVSASFNAPIAGAVFALEVILRHYALHAFAPIVVASVAGAVINRLAFGDVFEFDLPRVAELEFYAELPAFLILGLVCGGVSVILMRSIFWADQVGTRIQSALNVPRWMRPAFAGMMLGVIAIWFPVVIGVGYETTWAALTGRLELDAAILFAVVKTIAVAITMGGRMGGGVFSPSLMVGALTGLSFGLIATSVFPEVSGSAALYALAGMGAVAAAVLGGPLSTTLIVFELTGDWQTGLVVMIAISLSCAVSARFVVQSFFLTQLEKRNLHVAEGPQAYLPSLFHIGNFLRPIDEDTPYNEKNCWNLIRDGYYVDINGTLEAALPQLEKEDVGFIPVVQIMDGYATPELKGVLFHLDAMRAYNNALAAAMREEHS